MPRIIGQNRIPRVNIGNRGLTAKPGAGGGLIVGGQNYGAFATPGGVTTTFTVLKGGLALVYVFGAGGGGDGTNPGDGGGAAFRQASVAPGGVFQIVTGSQGSIGLAGGFSRVTFPTGAIVTATGGNGGSQAVAPGAGIGGEVNRTGGLRNGGLSPQPGGGLGGTAGGQLGGGAAAGFGDQAAFLIGGSGFNSGQTITTALNFAGGGGHGGGDGLSASVGAPGRVFILILA